MILDERTEFCDAVLLNTGAAGTYNLGDVIDTQVLRDLGAGQDTFLVITVDTGITCATSGTVQFALVSDAQDPFLTNGTQTTHMLSRAFPTSTTAIPAGTVLFSTALPVEGPLYERYIGIQQITGTAAVNAGRINAFLTTDQTRWKPYNDAI